MATYGPDLVESNLKEGDVMKIGIGHFLNVRGTDKSQMLPKSKLFAVLTKKFIWCHITAWNWDIMQYFRNYRSNRIISSFFVFPTKLKGKFCGKWIVASKTLLIYAIESLNCLQNRFFITKFQVSSLGSYSRNSNMRALYRNLSIFHFRNIHGKIVA